MSEEIKGEPGHGSAPTTPDGWQPIETVPKDGSEFVANFGRQGGVRLLVYFNTIHKYWSSKGEWVPGFESNATHWMPLPAAPKGETA